MVRQPPEECRAVWDLLDDLNSGELQAQARGDVLRHLEECPDCQGERSRRREVRHRLRAAWLEQEVPAGLEMRLRDTVLQGGSKRSTVLLRWAAAVLLASVALYLAIRFLPFSAPLEMVDHFHQVALNHIHCRETEKPDPEKMPASMRADLKVLDAAMQQVQADAPLRSAHLCSYRGVNFIHLVYMDARHHYSVLLEEHSASQRLAAYEPSRQERLGGLGVRVAEIEGVSVAYYQGKRHFVYLVLGEADPQRCIDLARTLFPPISASLGNL